MLWIASLLALITLSCGDPESPFRALPFDRAQSIAKEEQKIVLIDFFTTWCGPCKKLDSTTWKDPEVIAWMTKNCIALKLDAEQNTELASRFHVGAYPTIVLLKSDGTVIDSLVGYREPKAFLTDAADALAGRSSLSRAAEAAKAGEKNPTARMQYGDELARVGRYEEALAEYLWCFDNGRKSMGFAGVRLSFLLSDITRLGEKHPPALRALEERRDAAEARVLAAPTSFEELSDASALNRALKTPQRTIALYDRLRAAGPVSANAKSALGQVILAPLVEARRYVDALELFSKPEGFVRDSIRMHQSAEALRSKMGDAGDADLDAMLKGSIVGRCAPIYEALVGAGRDDKAAEVAEMLIAFAPAASTYVSLIDLAARAGRADTAKGNGAKGLAAKKDAADTKAIEQALARLTAPK